MVKIVVLVWLVGMVPAMWVTRRQWEGKRGAGMRAGAWAMAWPIWWVFWMAEEVFGDGR